MASYGSASAVGYLGNSSGIYAMGGGSGSFTSGYGNGVGGSGTVYAPVQSTYGYTNDYGHPRQSGRTTRLLKAADEAKSKGEFVLVVIGKQDDLGYMGKLVQAHNLLSLTKADFISLKQVVDKGFRLPRDGIVFIDHVVGEYAPDTINDIGRAFPYCRIVDGNGHMHEWEVIEIDDDDCELLRCLSCKEQEWNIPGMEVM